MARVSACRRCNSITTPTRVPLGGDPQLIGCGRSEVVFSPNHGVSLTTRRSGSEDSPPVPAGPVQRDARAGLTVQPSDPRNHVLRMASERCADGEDG